MEVYKRLKTESEPFNERADCAVIAVAALCNVSYQDAHAAMELAGRRPREGAKLHQIKAAIDILDFKVCDGEYIKQPNGARYTPITIPKRLTRGAYLCNTDSHVFACINGVVEDWTAGRRHRVINVYKILEG